MTRLTRCLLGSLAGLLALGGPWALGTAAAPHPGYLPVGADRVPTYRQGGAVGNMVFSLTFPEPQAEQPAEPLRQLVFRQQRPPAAWWGRSYHPCTLSEAISYLPDAARAFRVATLVHLDGQRISGTAFELEDEHLGPTWNTLSWDGSTVTDELAALAPGRHTLVVWRYLNYRLPQQEKGTRETVWEPRTLALAKGELPILVQP